MGNPGEKAELTPRHILRFHVAKRTFIASYVDVDERTDDLTGLTTDAAFNTRKEAAFLELMVEGKKSLYHYSDAGELSHFYIDRDGKPELLLFKRYLTGEGKGQAVASRNQFHTQLASYLFDCADATKQIPATAYDYNSLLKLFESYFTCHNKTAFTSKPKQRTTGTFGLMAGASHTTLKFHTSGTRTYLSDMKYDPSKNITGGVYGNIYFNRLLGLNNELFYTSFRMNGESERYTSENDYSIVKTHIGASYIKLSNQLSVRFATGRAKINLSAGLSSGLITKMTNEREQTLKYYNNEQTITGPAVEAIRRLETGFICGAAVSLQRYSAMLHYEKANGFSEASTIGAKVQRVYLFLGYSLSKN